MTTTVKPASTRTRYNSSFTLFRPNLKDHTKGSATSWEYNHETGDFFVTIAKQNESKDDNDNATFGWKANSQRILFNQWELGDIISVLSGRKAYLGYEDTSDKDIKKGKGLFHQTANGNAVIKLYRVDPNTLGFEISTKKNGVQFWAGHRINNGEAMTLTIVLTEVIKQMFVFAGRPVPTDAD